MNIILPYVIPMLLGRTFNITSDKVGTDIFPAGFQPTSINKQRTTSSHKMVETSRQARDFLNVGGELSLKIKSGMLSIKGSGEYLKDEQSRSKRIEVLTKVHFETVTETIPSSLRPVRGWTLKGPQSLGSHYVRSITYGGELVASLIFTAETTQEYQKIKAALSVGIPIYGPFGLDVEGDFGRTVKEMKDKTTLDIKYFANVPVDIVPTDMDSFGKLVERFPDMVRWIFELKVKKVNNGKGVPVRAELVPLHSLSSKYIDYLVDGSLRSELDSIELRFDDLRGASAAMRDWLSRLPSVTAAQEQEIAAFDKKVNDILEVFYDVIAKMDLSQQSGRRAQFDPAYNAYNAGGFGIPGTYMRQWNSIRSRIETGNVIVGK
ncbi:uncharacterized protein LOC106158722 isoform X1 [Lingula anatina]|uniref:Uncharacterized protein LOC106158722 isoform X1 n=1 Tax=Lingula anatina TaxID=7574 RepID=A0A1S3HW35_LINAN|nr:uncharacterized protein LOC106158722 isoform X1 [Lingula anatina]|eukprot:XP_013390257.1 uncharacterized protein LOC106158722 isoform X1 [Lingula anatina]